MKNKLLILVMAVISLTGFSQEIKRTLLSGKISAPSSEDLEGVSVYNVSSQKGTITDSEGKFKIAVSSNDRLLFTALQFQKFTVIVDESVIEKGEINVFINPAVVQLDEILVRPYDLYGNIKVDAARIQYSNIDDKIGEISYKLLEYTYEFAPDSHTAIEGNKSLEALGFTQQREGANLMGLVGILMKTKEPRLTKRDRRDHTDARVTAIRQRFPTNYFTDTLMIPEGRIDEFLYYAESNDFDLELLKEHNELQLMHFLEKKSKSFLQQTE
ncbi:MAG TPA: carboxypeptidase-like regulatory domain-containing protein [Flavobacteriaceae bacterium]|nr:carboxypeptidase-like regulatory domain-containing protein [Flavobacteriaceae bacterium]